jgi:hypothetical protein
MLASSPLAASLSGELWSLSTEVCVSFLSPSPSRISIGHRLPPPALRSVAVTAPRWWLIRLARTPNPARVAHYLMGLPCDQAGRVHVSRQQIARALQINKLDHVDRALDKLEELGIAQRGEVNTRYRPCAIVPITLNFGSEVTVL